MQGSKVWGINTTLVMDISSGLGYPEGNLHASRSRREVQVLLQGNSRYLVIEEFANVHRKLMVPHIQSWIKGFRYPVVNLRGSDDHASRFGSINSFRFHKYIILASFSVSS